MAACRYLSWVALGQVPDIDAFVEANVTTVADWDANFKMLKVAPSLRVPGQGWGWALAVQWWGQAHRCRHGLVSSPEIVTVSPYGFASAAPPEGR